MNTTVSLGNIKYETYNDLAHRKYLNIRPWTEKDAQMISEGAKNTQILCHARGE